MSNDVKVLRGQVRIAVKELMPEILKEQLYDDLKQEIAKRLTEVEKYMRETADLMNTRQKETLKYLVESYLGAIGQTLPDDVKTAADPESKSE